MQLFYKSPFYSHFCLHFSPALNVLFLHLSLASSLSFHFLTWRLLNPSLSFSTHSVATVCIKRPVIHHRGRAECSRHCTPGCLSASHPELESITQSWDTKTIREGQTEIEERVWQRGSRRKGARVEVDTQRDWRWTGETVFSWILIIMSSNQFPLAVCVCARER